MYRLMTYSMPRLLLPCLSFYQSIVNALEFDSGCYLSIHSSIKTAGRSFCASRGESAVMELDIFELSLAFLHDWTARGEGVADMQTLYIHVDCVEPSRSSVIITLLTAHLFMVVKF